jgi:hypothetical protein
MKTIWYSDFKDFPRLAQKLFAAISWNDLEIEKSNKTHLIVSGKLDLLNWLYKE